MRIVAGDAGIHPDLDRVERHVPGSIEVAGATDLVQSRQGIPGMGQRQVRIVAV